LADAVAMIRESVRDKSYRAYPLGGESGHYLRWKRGSLTASSYRDYESALDKLARDHCDLELADFEPPVGTERLEEFLDDRWGASAPRTYNKTLSVLRDFFKWAVLKGKLHGDPTLPIVRRKTRGVERTIFSQDQERAIVGAQDSLRDRIALRLLFHTGIRKGSLRDLQFKHFDHARRRVMVFAKGGKVRELPVVDASIWLDLERHILDWGAQPSDFLMCRRKVVPHKRGRGSLRHTEMDVVETRDKPMSAHGLHDWWYGCLERAQIVSAGQRSGERLHKTRHTAGQRMLDSTGNLKAVQQLLGHADIRTTADVYVDWDIQALEASMKEVLEDEKRIVPHRPGREPPG
jgi:site-specific recombinase XerC